MRFKENLPVPMRDGTVLYGDLYCPDGAENEAYPSILVRTPYEKNGFHGGVTSDNGLAYVSPALYVEKGYAVFIQDCRGTGESEGFFRPWMGDATDGYDTVEWMAQQPWCTGAVGMMGCSNLGSIQLLTAASRPPHLKCIAPAGTSDGFPFVKDGVIDLAGTSIWYMQQAVKTTERAKVPQKQLEQLKTKMKELQDNIEQQFTYLPLREIPFAHVDEVQMEQFFVEYVDHEGDAGFWTRDYNPIPVAAIEVPTLLIVNWYDHLARQMFMLYKKMSTFNPPACKDNLYLYIGPWRVYAGIKGSDVEDCIPGDRPPQPVWANGKRLSDIQVDWFDHWLKDEKSEFDLQNHVFVQTLGANRGRYEAAWPLPGTNFVKYFLNSHNGANTCNGDGVLTTERPTAEDTADRYTYDPMEPTPTRSGVVINPKDSLRQDQSAVEEREDVLCYTTAPFAEETEITGPMSLRLWAATDCLDTDFVVKVIDVDPEGKPLNLTEGVVRARFKNGWEKPELLIPGAVYEYDIFINGVGIVFPAGHALRIEVSSCNFPKWDRNLNTGDSLGQKAEYCVAHQTIYHDRRHPSYLLVPVIHN